MGLFSRRDPEAAEARIARLETHLSSLQTYLEDVARAESEAAAQQPEPQPAPQPSGLAAPGANDSADPALGSGPPRIVNADMVEEALRDLQARMEELSNGLTQMDARLTSMGTELTNQLSELGQEIDALANLEGEPLEGGLLNDLKATQVRLAQEQARYQIAFKQDLAELAERLSRRN